VIAVDLADRGCQTVAEQIVSATDLIGQGGGTDTR
jgi:hypothetical protein